MYAMRILITLIILIICSISDIRNREIDIRVLFPGIIFLFIRIYSCSDYSRTMLSLLPGVIMLILSLVYPGIGAGDAYMFIFLGACYDVRIVVNTMVISIFMACIFALVMLILKKADRSFSLPYAPFILVAFLAAKIVNISL